MEDLVALSGASPIELNFKNECCGASHQISVPKTGRTMIRRILENAAANDCRCHSLRCPLCMLNLDMREARVNAARAKKDGLPPLDIPIYYFTRASSCKHGCSCDLNPASIVQFHPAGNLHERAITAWNKQRAAAKKKLRKQKNPQKRRNGKRAAARAPI